MSHLANWSLLGIQPTDDERAIRSAYARRLKTTRPDDDPAEYQKLREAYDAALLSASSEKSADAGKALDTPVAAQADEAQAEAHVLMLSTNPLTYSSDPMEMTGSRAVRVAGVTGFRPRTTSEGVRPP